jgi:hypothetical protein
MGFPVNVVSSVFPAGAATEAKQDDVVTAIGTEQRRISRPYAEAIAEGDIAGHFPVRLRGDIQNATNVWTDIWGGAPATATVPLLSTTISAEIVSSSAQDAVGGTGAGKVSISYLTTDGVLVGETITLLGATPVALANPLLHVQKVCIVEGGTSVTTLAAGNIDVRLVGGAATVYARIPIGRVCTPRFVFRVPAGQSMYLTHVNAFGLALANNSDMQLRLVSNTEQGVALPLGVWQTIFSTGAGPGGTTTNGPIPVPLAIPAGAVVKAQARRVGGSGNCDASIAAYGWRE